MRTSLTKKPHATFLVAMFGVILELPGMATAQVSDICIPPIGGLVAQPTMDGKTFYTDSSGNNQADIGWNGAAQFGMRDITQRANGPVAVSTGRSGRAQYGILNNFLYISVDIDNGVMSSPGVNDAIVIALSPDKTGATTANDWRLHIFPFVVADTGAGATFDTHRPREVDFWRNSGTWNTSGSGTLSPLPISAKSTGDPSTGTVDTSTASSCNPLQTAQFVVARNGGRWGLEAKLPYATYAQGSIPPDNCKIYLPTGNNEFKLYVDAVSTNDFATATAGGGTYVEDPWPYQASAYLAANNGLGGLLETSTPDPSAWGTASLDTNPGAGPGKTTRSVCTGVSITTAGVIRQGGTTPGTTSDAAKDPSYTGVDPITHNLYYLKDPHNPGSLKLESAADCADNANPNHLANDDYWNGLNAIKSTDNTFIAHVTNNTGTTADVAANFYIAPWGLPAEGDWDRIGDRYRPTSRSPLNPTPTPPLSVSSTGADLSTVWNLSYKESCAYALSGLAWSGVFHRGHHCVQAELQSSGGTVNFIRKSLQFNHDIVAASRAEHEATIGTKGYGSPPQGKAYHEILLNIDQLARKYGRDGNFYYPQPNRSSGENADRSSSPAFSNFGPIAAELFPKGMTEALGVVARGYRLTGDNLVIGGNAYHRAQYVGAFSLEAGHNGPVDKWTVELSSAIACPANGQVPPQGCLSGSGTTYVARIPKDESLQVVTTVEAHEPSQAQPSASAIWLGLGRTYPQGSFGDNYDIGTAAELGYEYAFSNTYSVEATLGRHRFDGKGGLQNLDVTKFGVNAKWYFPQPSFKPFVTLGLGSYSFDPGSTRTGVNAGLGVQFDIAPHWSVEGRYGWNHVSGNAPNTNYSTLLFDLRYAF